MHKELDIVFIAFKLLISDFLGHKSVTKNNLVCNENELGDGICQDYNNGPLCDYDLGDCCLRFLPNENDECCFCFCHDTHKMLELAAEYFNSF